MELNFYTLPFTNYHGRVFDANNNFIFQFMTNDKIRSQVIDILNGTVNPTHLRLEVNKEDNGQIDMLHEAYDKPLPFILIRGWGNLTGVGAHNLDHNTAAKIQDDLRDWIIYKLTTVNNETDQT